MISATCIAPVNIAVVKYWGKRDEELILPINDSISGTLCMDQMKAKTSIAASPTFTETKLWLNGQLCQMNSRAEACINAIKQLAEKKNVDKEKLSWHLHICSENNFPTAAGLASSAAGYSCLVYTLASLYGINDENISSIARQGSGSACRSMFGGFVHWIKGELKNGEDSISVQLVNENHWPEVHVLILVVDDKRKKVASTSGMSRSVHSSELIQYRVKKCVAPRITQMKKAIADKNFPAFAKLTMKDSNQFHAVCLDSYPPAVYMNDISHKISEVVHRYNEAIQEVKVAYTFDAGPNACLYIIESEVPKMISILNAIFPNDNADTPDYVRGISVPLLKFSKEQLNAMTNCVEYERNLLKYIIHTKIGEGPKQLDESESLLDSLGSPLVLENHIDRKKVKTEKTEGVKNVEKSQKSKLAKMEKRKTKNKVTKTEESHGESSGIKKETISDERMEVNEEKKEEKRKKKEKKLRNDDKSKDKEKKKKNDAQETVAKETVENISAETESASGNTIVAQEIPIDKIEEMTIDDKTNAEIDGPVEAMSVDKAAENAEAKVNENVENKV